MGNQQSNQKRKV